MMNLNNISTEALERIQKILKIVLDELELQNANGVPFYKITSKRFEEKGFSYDETITILNKINIQVDAFIIVNEYYREKKEKEKEEASILSPHHKKDHIFLPNSEMIKEQIERELHPHPIESLELEQYLDTNIVLIVENLNELKKIKESVDKKLKKIAKIPAEKIKSEAIKKDKKVEKITLIKMNNGKYLFAINDNYKETKKISDNSEWWQIFIHEVRDRNLPCEKRTDVEEISKEMADYFNYNAEKCPIYFKGKYKLTNIFIGRSVDTMINSDIKTEIISEKKYLTRKEKKEKKNKK